MNTTATLESLEQEARARGGGTRHLNARRGRYVVGGLATATARLGDSLIEAAAKLTEAMADATADTVGSWLENGLVYYDLGTVTDDEATAQQWAEERGEIAYYDMKAQTSIYTCV